jgi:hypothetical protein
MTPCSPRVSWRSSTGRKKPRRLPLRPSTSTPRAPPRSASGELRLLLLVVTALPSAGSELRLVLMALTALPSAGELRLVLAGAGAGSTQIAPLNPKVIRSHWGFWVGSSATSPPLSQLLSLRLQPVVPAVPVVPFRPGGLGGLLLLPWGGTRTHKPEHHHAQARIRASVWHACAARGCASCDHVVSRKDTIKMV